jgi:phosphate transport system substrate-binding protein
MKKILFSCAVVMTLLSCGNNKKEDAAGTGSGSASIAIDGSSTVYPITEAVAEEFRAEHPDVDVTIGVSGTGGGFKKFGRGEIDIADASRPIKDEERITAQSNKIDYVGLEVAYDGLAVVVHPENDWLTCITTEET